MGCGCEVGGSKAKDLGVCAAATCASAHGRNRGTNGGRYCWRIAGTLYGGRRNGTVVDKILGCMHCDFLEQVRAEEGDNFEL
jgi:hypothetical protein